MKVSYQSRGKGYMEIVRDARKMLDLAVTIDSSNGKAMLRRDDIVTILSQVDDEDHFREPLATALFDFIMERDAVIVVSSPKGRKAGSA